MSKVHDVNFPPHARLTGYEVHRGNLTMYDEYGDAFHTKLKGHNQLNEEYRLQFQRDRHGWEVRIQPQNSHGYGRHGSGRVHVDDECAIGAVIGGIIGGKENGSEGAIIGAGVGCAIGEIIENQKDKKRDNDRGGRRDRDDHDHKGGKHNKHSSLSGDDNDGIEGLLKDKASRLLLGANFSDHGGDPNATTRDLVETNATDITPAEIGDVPVELAMESNAELKQSATVTA